MNTPVTESPSVNPGTEHVLVEPNLFIVGAPKCGTTSLYRYLRQHPDVFMSDPKEPHFWSTDLHRPGRIMEDRYWELFREGAGKKCIGEASTEYLYSREACERIHRTFPAARIVILLRNPVDMIHSGHAQRLWHGREDIEDFEEALAAEADRRRGRRLPPYPYPVETLIYREVGKFSKYVRRYIKTFGPERVHVIIFEDFVRDTARIFEDLCRFLGIDPGVAMQFDRYNANKKPRIRRLSLLFVPTGTARRVGRRMPRSVRRIGGAVASALMKWNTQYEKRSPMRPELRHRLEEEFAEDVADLSALLGRDLAARWFKDGSTVREKRGSRASRD